MNYSIKLQFIPLMKGEEHISMWVIFHSPSVPITVSYQEKLLDSDPEKPELVHAEQMLKPLLQGTNPCPPAEGHGLEPAGADPNPDHITPSWDPLQHTDHSPVKPKGRWIHTQTAETPPSPALWFPVAHFVFPHAKHSVLFFVQIHRSCLSYFDSGGSLHLSLSVISRPERLDRHLGSAAGEDRGKAGR